jgi:hypothetical protein
MALRLGTIVTKGYGRKQDWSLLKHCSRLRLYTPRVGTENFSYERPSELARNLRPIYEEHLVFAVIIVRNTQFKQKLQDADC